MNTEDKKTKSKTITFQPDEDVREILNDILSAYDDPYGYQTKVINEALREELPRLVQRWLDRQQQIHDKLSARFSNRKRPSKGQ